MRQALRLIEDSSRAHRRCPRTRRRIGATGDAIIPTATSADAKTGTYLRRMYIYYIVRVKQRSVSIAIAFEKT